jgi:hypothetical protein
MAECGLDFEDARLAALYEYDVLDTPPEESFDRITRLVKLSLGVPTSVVSLVDRDRQWFKSRQGTDTVETPRSISFCTHTIQKDEPLIVTNALEDPRFANSPLVTCEGGVRMYVGQQPAGHLRRRRSHVCRRAAENAGRFQHRRTLCHRQQTRNGHARPDQRDAGPGTAGRRRT